MEFIKEFESYLEYQEYLNNPHDNNPKLFYISNEDKIIINNKELDINDFDNVNSTVSIKDETDDNCNLYLYNKRISLNNSNIKIGKVFFNNGYSIDIDNSKIYIGTNEDKTLLLNSEWEYNVLNHEITILRNITGNLYINFKSLNNSSLSDGNFKIGLEKENIITDIYESGNETINNKDLILETGIYNLNLSNETPDIYIDVVKGNDLCYVENNKLYLSGYKYAEKDIEIVFYSLPDNSIKPFTFIKNIKVIVKEPELLNYDEILNSNNIVDNKILAGNTLDLSGLRISGNLSYSIETSNNLKSIGLYNKFKVIGSGLDNESCKIIFNIKGNQYYSDKIIIKSLYIKLKDNHISWKNISDNNITIYHGEALKLEVNAIDNVNKVKYILDNDSLGTFIGNTFYPSLNDNKSKIINITASIEESGDYNSCSTERLSVNILPVNITIDEFIDNTNTFYMGDSFNLNVKSVVPYKGNSNLTGIPYTNIISTSVLLNNNQYFNIENGRILKFNESNNSIDVNDYDNFNVSIETTINYGKGYEILKIQRNINCKRRDVEIYILEPKYINYNKPSQLTLVFEDLISKNKIDLTQEILDLIDSNLEVYYSNNYYNNFDEVFDSEINRNIYKLSKSTYSYTQEENNINLNFNLNVRTNYIYLKLKTDNFNIYKGIDSVITFIVVNK